MPINVTTTASPRPPTAAELPRLKLMPDEAAVCHRLTEQVLAAGSSAGSADFLRDVACRGHELPRRLRRFLIDMRTRERAAAWVVSGFAVDDGAIGPTPEHWSGPSATRREDLWLMLCGSLLGDVFGWATQQGGALVHEIAPIRGEEHSQLGSGSTALLWWHTEEAFHPLRCDYLGLLCLRNHRRVPTTFASIGDVHLDDDTLSVLFEPRFVIRPDDSHLIAHAPGASGDGRLLVEARRRIERMNQEPEKVPVLYGAFDSPYLSVDPFYMDVSDDDPAAHAALVRLCRAIDEQLKEVALASGEILFIDNYRAVHGRKPFRARYDGTDRWLKRIVVTRDLRKSRAQRATSESRIIY
jgi:Fe(II)/alpha-ketoglutarate-dependent arginine beta-hydroxylase